MHVISPITMLFGKKKGLSPQKQLRNLQLEFTKDLAAKFKQVYGKNLDLYDQLHKSFGKTMEAGINQGIPAAVDSAWRTSAHEEAAAGKTEMAQTLAQTIAARGGGSIGGATTPAMIQAQEESGQKFLEGDLKAQRDITMKEYELGRQNYEFAASGMMNLPSILKGSEGFAGAEISSAGQTEGIIKDINASKFSWLSPILGLAGAAAGGMVGGPAGAKVGGSIASNFAPTPDPVTGLGPGMT